MKKFNAMVIVLGGSLLISTQVHSEISFPTVWSYSNNSSSKIYLECKAPSPAGLLSKLEMKITVNPNETKKYKWGNGWYNDGLGLNPGSFSCAVGKNKNPLNKGNTARINFITTWGESISINITELNNRFIISKED